MESSDNGHDWGEYSDYRPGDKEPHYINERFLSDSEHDALQGLRVYLIACLEASSVASKDVFLAFDPNLYVRFMGDLWRYSEKYNDVVFAIFTLGFCDITMAMCQSLNHIRVTCVSRDNHCQKVSNTVSTHFYQQVQTTCAKKAELQADILTFVVEVAYRSHSKLINDKEDLSWFEHHFRCSESVKDNEFLSQMLSIIGFSPSGSIPATPFVSTPYDVRKAARYHAALFQAHFQLPRCNHKCFRKPYIQGHALLSLFDYNQNYTDKDKIHSPVFKSHDSSHYVFFAGSYNGIIRRSRVLSLQPEILYKLEGHSGKKTYVSSLVGLREKKWAISTSENFGPIRVSTRLTRTQTYEDGVQNRSKFLYYCFESREQSSVFFENPWAVADSEEHFGSWMSWRLEGIFLAFWRCFEGKPDDFVDYLRSGFSNPLESFYQRLVGNVLPKLEIMAKSPIQCEYLLPEYHLFSTIPLIAHFPGVRSNAIRNYKHMKVSLRLLQSIEILDVYRVLQAFSLKVEGCIRAGDVSGLKTCYDALNLKHQLIKCNVIVDPLFRDFYFKIVRICFDKKFFYFYDHEEKSWITPLMLAVKMDQYDIVRFLIEDVGVSIKDSSFPVGLYGIHFYSLSALSYAIPSSEIYDYLIERKAHVYGFCSDPLSELLGNIAFQRILLHSEDDIKKFIESGWPVNEDLKASFLETVRGIPAALQPLSYLLSHYGQSNLTPNLKYKPDTQIPDESQWYAYYALPDCFSSGAANLHPWQKEHVLKVVELIQEVLNFDRYMVKIYPCGFSFELNIENIKIMTQCFFRQFLLECLWDAYHDWCHDLGIALTGRDQFGSHYYYGEKLNLINCVPIIHLDQKGYSLYLNVDSDLTVKVVAKNNDSGELLEERTASDEAFNPLMSLCAVLPECFEMNSMGEELKLLKPVEEVIDVHQSHYSYYRGWLSTFGNRIMLASRYNPFGLTYLTSSGGFNHRPGSNQDRFYPADNEFPDVPIPAQCKAEDAEGIDTTYLLKNPENELFWFRHFTDVPTSTRVDEEEFVKDSLKPYTLSEIRDQYLGLYYLAGKWTTIFDSFFERLSILMTEIKGECVTVFHDVSLNPMHLGVDQAVLAGKEFGYVRDGDGNMLSDDALAYYDALAPR